MTSPTARNEMLRAIPHLQELGRVTPEEARQFEEAIEATGRDGVQATHTQVPGKLMTRKQVAEILGLSGRTVARMEKAGKIRSVKVGVRLVRFRAEDIEALTTDNASAA
jgi:excisionase family DNA binding protein